MKVRTTMCLASAVMAIGVVSWPVAAHADAGVSGRLCADPTHECTVSVMGGHAREVAYSGVDVTGARGFGCVWRPTMYAPMHTAS
ncbi:hypothetical protein JCM18909_2038 [Cutibacterium acnes JCM 18909]|nr:hypothetical protein JCM18909_2038 [Cutibacterium acnes JCM 18909]